MDLSLRMRNEAIRIKNYEMPKIPQISLGACTV